MAEVVVYTRQGCKLCEAAETIAARVAGPADRLRLVDIDTDPELYRRYTVRVPVVAVDGREVAELQISEDDLRAVLGQR
jgi:glutaredoxin